MMPFPSKYHLNMVIMTTGKPESIQEGSSKESSKCFFIPIYATHCPPLPLNRFKKTLKNHISSYCFIPFLEVYILASGSRTRFPLGTEARSLEQAVSCAADIRACPTPCLGLEGSLVDDGVYGAGTFRNLVGKFDEFFIVC